MAYNHPGILNSCRKCNGGSQVSQWTIHSVGPSTTLCCLPYPWHLYSCSMYVYGPDYNTFTSPASCIQHSLQALWKTCKETTLTRLYVYVFDHYNGSQNKIHRWIFYNIYPVYTLYLYWLFACLMLCSGTLLYKCTNLHHYFEFLLSHINHFHLPQDP